MDLNVLSLKWNNHKTTFLNVISNLRNKASYTDATLACDGRFYPVHRLVLSTCSEYFSEVFEQTTCKHPVIILKDVESKNIEYLLDYMYIGEVNVKQNELASLVGTAECLKIKGLAVPDEESVQTRLNTSNKRLSTDFHRSHSPPMKKKRTSKDFFGTSNFTDSEVEKSKVEEPNFIAIKCEPNSDDEVVQENNILSDYSCRPKSDITNVILDESEKSIDNRPIEKEEPQDLPDDLNHLSSIVTNDNEYMPDSDASTSQTHEEALFEFSQSSESTLQENLEENSISINTNEVPTSNTTRILSGVEFQEALYLSGIRVFQCTVCSYSSKIITNAKNHARIHTGEKPFKCQLCDYKSAQQCNLKQHMYVHTGEKPFKCRICSYKTTHKKHLNEHMRIHTGEKPFECLHCNYKASMKSLLAIHAWNNHNIDILKDISKIEPQKVNFFS